MMRNFQNFLKQPLLHFFLLSTAIFAAYQLFGEPATVAADSIVVSPGKIENLAALFQRTWQRPPNPEELNGLIQDYVREEVLYREGMAMGLDRDDTVIRRRIRQKMDFIVEDMMAQADPGDAQLQQYLQQHADQFRVPPSFSFQQIYLNPEKHSAALQQDVEKLLAGLRQTPGRLDATTLGDSIMLEPAYQNLALHQVSRLFGEDFATTLEGLPAGTWQGPVKSGYGVHLVKIGERIDGRLPELAEVRDSVLREWDNARRNEAREKFYQSLLERYSVVIEPLRADNAAAAMRTVEAGQ